MGFGDAVASAGPYANNLHLAANRYPHQHLMTLILAGRVLFLTPNKQRQSTKGINQLTLRNYSVYTAVRIENGLYNESVAVSRIACTLSLCKRHRVISTVTVPRVTSRVSAAGQIGIASCRHDLSALSDCVSTRRRQSLSLVGADAVIFTRRNDDAIASTSASSSRLLTACLPCQTRRTRRTV